MTGVKKIRNALDTGGGETMLRGGDIARSARGRPISCGGEYPSVRSLPGGDACPDPCAPPAEKPEKGLSGVER